MSAYERWMRHLRAAVAETIAEIPPAQRDDVYVIHLALETEDEDNRRVMVTVAWNTVRHLRAEQADVDADERMDCEWEPLTFAQPEARVIGATDEDVELRTRWLQEAGLWYEDEHQDLALTDEDGRIWDAFRSSLVEIAQTLHADGSIERVLGRDVPVLLDAELESEDSMRALNRRANPAPFHPQLDRWSARGLADE